MFPSLVRKGFNTQISDSVITLSHRHLRGVIRSMECQWKHGSPAVPAAKPAGLALQQAIVAVVDDAFDLHLLCCGQLITTLGWYICTAPCSFILEAVISGKGFCLLHHG